MESTRRIVAVTALAAALTVAACGGSNPAPTGAAATSVTTTETTADDTTSGSAGGDFEAKLKALGPALLAPIFGASIPTPTCTTSGEEAVQCRWNVNDGELLLDADADPTFESEEAWREAFGTAGFDEEIPRIGVAALGGDNPLSEGWRASAYGSDGVAYTVTINKSGDQAAVKAMATAILKALAG
jgi:hypothetical protein